MINRRNVVLSVTIMMILSLSLLHAQEPPRNIFTLGGGITKAIGDENEGLNTGFNVAGTMLMPMTRTTYLGAKAAYNHMGVDTKELEDFFVPGVDISASISILEILGIVRIISVPRPNETARFFLQGGFGMYMVTGKATVSYMGESESDSDSESEAGFNVGLGLIFGDPRTTQIEITPNLNIILMEDESTKYFTVNIGVVFNN